MLHDILGVPFLFFTAQTSFDSSISILYLSLLNALLWYIYIYEKSEPPSNIRSNKHRDDCKITTSIDIDQLTLNSNIYDFRLPGHSFNEQAVFTVVERLNTRTKTKLEHREILKTQEDYWIMSRKLLR